MMNTNENKANSLGSQTASAADVSAIADSEERVDFEDDSPEEGLDENASLEEDKWFAANWEDDPFDDSIADDLAFDDSTFDGATSNDLSLDDAPFFAEETSEEDEFVFFSEKIRKSPPRTRGQAHRAEVPPFQSLMSQETRDFLRARFPGLDEHNLWGLFAFLFLVGPDGRQRFHRWNEPVVAPRDAVARAVGKNPTSHGFTLKKTLELFSKQVMPLNILPHDVATGLATRVVPRIPQDVERVLNEERRRLTAVYFETLRQQKPRTSKKQKLAAVEAATKKPPKARKASSPAVVSAESSLAGDAEKPGHSLRGHGATAITLVSTVTGEKATARILREQSANYRKFLDRKNRPMPDDHPAREMALFLQERNKGRKERQVFLSNLEALEEALDKVPDDAPESIRRRRDLARREIVAMAGNAVPHYGHSNGTTRLSNKGASPLKLPREYRAIAYRGAHEFDLAACQLAIVSKLWNIPQLRQRLKAGLDIWTELYEALGVGAKFKPALKQGIYSIVFGGTVKNIKRKMQQKMQEDTEISPEHAHEVVKHFFSHPLVKEVLSARNRQAESIRRNKGAKDAFKRPHRLRDTFTRLREEDKSSRTKPVEWHVKPHNQEEQHLKWQWKKKAIRSLMAYVVQSFELRFMLALLPVMRKDRQIYPHGLLYDALIVSFGHEGRKERAIQQFKKAIQDLAEELDMPVRLEHKIL